MVKYKCYICNKDNVTWDADLDAYDIGMENDGIVHNYHCMSCGSRITVLEPLHKMIKRSGYYISQISHSLADDFLKRHHYLAQQGNGFLGKVNYGLFTEGHKFIGVCIFGGISVIETLIGAFEGFDRKSDQTGFWELTRLAMDDNEKIPNLTSWFVSHCIKNLRGGNNVRAIISYADSKYHKGYIYQATNFKYYGLTSPKSDFFCKSESGEKQVWRGSTKGVNGEWRPRSRKHRYMIVYDKSLKILWEEKPYPKGENSEYELKTPEYSQTNLFDFIGE